jgi:hypothetical protein
MVVGVTLMVPFYFAVLRYLNKHGGVMRPKHKQQTSSYASRALRDRRSSRRLLK